MVGCNIISSTIISKKYYLSITIITTLSSGIIMLVSIYSRNYLVEHNINLCKYGSLVVFLINNTRSTNSSSNA